MQKKIRWEKQKDLECWDFFKMSWKEFKTLGWAEQGRLRQANGISWKDGQWVKKGN